MAGFYPGELTKLTRAQVSAELSYTRSEEGRPTKANSRASSTQGSCTGVLATLVSEAFAMPARSWLVGGGQVARLEIGWLEIGWWKPHWRPPAAKLRSFGASHRSKTKRTVAARPTWPPPTNQGPTSRAWHEHASTSAGQAGMLPVVRTSVEQSNIVYSERPAATEGCCLEHRSSEPTD